MAATRWLTAALIAALAASGQGSDPTLSSAGSPKVICVRNACAVDMLVAVYYEKLSGEWGASCWWQVLPGQLGCLADNDGPLRTLSSEWYVHAEAPSLNVALAGEGTPKEAECGGRKLLFYKLQAAEGQSVLAAEFSCHPRSAPQQGLLHHGASHGGGVRVAGLPGAAVGEPALRTGLLRIGCGATPAPLVCGGANATAPVIVP